MRLASPPTSYQLPAPSATQQLLAQQLQPVATTLQEPPPAGLPHWLSYAPTAGVGVLAVIAATTVAVLNWRTAQKKLKFDMFNRRLEVYEALLDVRYAIQKGTFKHEDFYITYKRAIATAHWVFEKDLLQVIEDFTRRLESYWPTYQQWREWMGRNDEKKIAELQKELEKIKSDVLGADLEGAFHKYLHVPA